MSEQIAGWLQGCASPDFTVRSTSETSLLQARQANLPQLVVALIQILAAPTAPPTVRQQSGLYLKLVLGCKSYTFNTTLYDTEANKAALAAVDANSLTTVKTELLTTLHDTERIARDTAAQCIAELASLTLPSSSWPELLPNLLGNVTSNTTSDGVKVSTLSCLGYTAEGLQGEELPQEVTNVFLTAIVDGVRKVRSDPIRFAAMTALTDSLLFCRSNMDRAAERNQIFQVICEGTQSTTSEELRKASYECVVQMAEHYYHHLKDYMQVLFQLTFATIKTDCDDVATNAIEFWSTLSEVEMELSDIAEDDPQAPISDPTLVCQRYVVAALEHLTPLLLECMTKQDEDAEPGDDVWNLAMAAATCMQLVADVAKDAVVERVIPFTLQNIRNENWRLREASTMAFCCILQGPSTEKIGPYVQQSIPVLVEALKDPNLLVKDTTAWTLSRLCELHLDCLAQDAMLALLQGLMGPLLTESPTVSAHSCMAIHNIAIHFDCQGQPSSPLSPYMPKLIEELLKVADRGDWSEGNLRMAAYDAISMLIQHASVDCEPLFAQLAPVVLDRLAKSMQMPILTNDDKEAKEGLQTYLCSLILVLIRQLSDANLAQFADGMMGGLLTIFSTKNAVSHQEAFLAAGALADKLEGNFAKYLDHFHPALVMGLKNREAYSVCKAAVGVVGDLCRALEAQMFGKCDEIMMALLENLQDPALNRSVKPAVLACFGDIALAINGDFEKYVQVTLTMLEQASQTRAPDDDDESIEYVNTLREGILEAYTGIIQGLKDGNKQDMVVRWQEGIVGFLETITGDQNKDEAVLSGAIGCLGDLCDALGTKIPGLAQKQFVPVLLAQGDKTGDQGIIDVTNYTRSKFEAIRAANGMGGF